MDSKTKKVISTLGGVLLIAGASNAWAAQVIEVENTEQLLAALSSVEAGDTIALAPGTYTTSSTAGEFPTADGDTVWRRWFFRGEAEGTAEAPITLTSQDASDPAVLSGTGWDQSGYALYITGDHWLVKDLKVTGAAKGLMVSSSDYSQFVNVEVYDIGQEGVHIIDGSSYTVFDGINVHDVGKKDDGYGEGIYVGSDNGVWWEGDGTNTGEKGFYYHRDVVGTHIKNSIIGPNITAEPFDIKEGASGTIVENNQIYATGISGNNFADSHIDIKGYETVVKYNTFYQNDNLGLLRSIMIVPRISAGVDAEYTAHHNYVHDNTFYLNEDVEVLVANSGSEEIYAWDNIREPSDGNYYNSRVIQEKPEGYGDETGETYSVTASAGANGSIAPSGDIEVEEGAQQTFVFTPDSGYVVEEVLVNGNSVGAVESYSFTNIGADQSISVSFVLETSDTVFYEVTAGVVGGGSISPAGTLTVAEGNDQSFTFTADTGYELSDVMVNGSSVGLVDSYTFTGISANQTITAYFSEIELATFEVTATAGDNGSITPSGSIEVLEGESQTFTFDADSGYEVAEVIVNGEPLGAVDSYTLSDVAADAEISVSFKEVEEIVGDYIEVTAPFIYDGAGSFKWKTTEVPSHINSWNLSSLTINGEDITNSWTSSGNLPEKVDGYYYFEYVGEFNWSHIQIK